MTKLRQNVVLTLLACAFTATSALAKDVVLYSSANTEAIEAATGGFSELHPDIKVSVIRAGSGSLMQRLKAEATNPQADLVWAGTPGTMTLYKDLFEPYKSPEAKNYPAELIGEDNRWLSVDTNLHVLMVNTKALKGLPAPTTWSDLFTPAWKGKIIMGNPEQSSSALEQVSGVGQFFGQAARDSLAQNAATVSTSSAVNSGVAKGEFPVAITLEYLAQDYFQHGAKNIQIVYPKEGVFVSYFTTAIVKAAKNRESAQLLYDFIASKPGRERILKASYRRPGRKDIAVESVSPLPPYDKLTLKPIDEAKTAAEYTSMLARWKQLSQGN